MRTATALAALLCAAGPAFADPALADQVTDDAKAVVAAATAPAAKWDGPTTGPAAVGAKTIVYVAGDLRNGGIQGVADGMKEAAAAIGWTLRVLDGQGDVTGTDSAFGQAIALKPDGIVVGGFDVVQNAVKIEEATSRGIVVVAWHGGPKPGPMPEQKVFANVGTDSDRVAEVAADYAIAKSDGHAGVVIFTDSAYAIALHKARAMESVIKTCAGCTVLSFEDTPLADTSNRMPQLATSLLQRFGQKWTYSLAINDLYFDFIAPPLVSAGVDPAGPPANVSAGDGSNSAYERVRTGQYQTATVPEPLSLHGWQLTDELNRAFAHQAPSGYVAPVHLVVQANADRDGGPRGVYDPDSGYRDVYKRIWTK